MKKFMAVFTGTPAQMEKWKALDEATRNARQKEGFAAWEKWGKDHAQAIVDAGAPLGKTKRVDSKGIHDIRNQLAVYTLVEAESHEEAAKIFLNHPHFTQFPGDAVEVMECLPIPARP